MSFLRLQPTDIVVSSDSIVTPAWSQNQPTLSSFFTSSLVEDNNAFFINVYNLGVANPSTEVQFSISYGHKGGSGSLWFNQAVIGNSPTKVTYGQYRTLIYGDENKDFNFGKGETESEVYIINLDRERYKEHILPGSLSLRLAVGTNVITLTDNSRELLVNEYLDGGRVFQLVSGSSGIVVSQTIEGCNCDQGTTISGSYGLLLPDIGVIVLNKKALELPVDEGGLAFTSVALSNNSDNPAEDLLNAIVAGGSFTLLSEETVSSNYIFIRIPNQEFNYTLNPSAVNEQGELIYTNFIQNPQTYPTTIGLYNDNNELLAVGKLSKPLVKDFTKEALLRVKLNW